MTNHVQGGSNECSALTRSLPFCQKIIRSHAKCMVRSQGKKERKKERGDLIIMSEKGKHLFMSFIQWQDRAGHLSPTDGNHL